MGFLGAEAGEGDAELGVTVAPALGGVRLVVLLDGWAERDGTSGQRRQQASRS